MKRIVVLGPESTGKSTLCEQLAMHFRTDWCPEYAREFLLVNGTDYSYDDLLTIAKGQLTLEDKTGQRVKDNNAGVLFIDTDMYVMKVWCEFVFGKCHRYILDQIVSRKYDLYLLCNVDLPWVKDVLREYPDLETRRTLYSIYKDIMINQAVPWVEISGEPNNRLAKAIEAVSNILS